MLAQAIGRALADLPSAPFRAALWKSLGLTLLALVGLWFAARALFAGGIRPWLSPYLPALPAWAQDAGTAAGWIAGLLLGLGLVFLVGPVSAAVAGLFLDDVAVVVERERYPAVAPGRGVPLLTGIRLSAQFFGVVILGNLLAFALLFVPGVNLVAFFAVNGYLLGREYFEFAAMRYRPEAEAKAMRRRHRGTVFLGGAAVTLLLAVPVLNLLAPLFAAALMVNLHQLLSARAGTLPPARPAPERLGRL